MADIVRFRSPLRYRSSLSPLPFSSTIRADSSLAGPNRFFWHTFSLDYRDVDWLVEVFSSFLDGPSPIVAKVLIKSGRSKLYPWLTRSCRAGKRGLPSPSSGKRRNPEFPSLEIDREEGRCWRRRFPRISPQTCSLEYLDRSWKWTMCIIYNARLFPLKGKKLWSHWHCAVSFTRGSRPAFR